MSSPTTCEATRNTTSLPVSASGASPCAEQDGQMIAKSGLDHAHANLSARQAKERGLLTSGTYGPPSSTSSSSAALQSSLASRLRQRTASLGSTLYKLTWKERVTPAGRRICALRASVPRTGGSVYYGWPTPTSAIQGSSEAPAARAARGYHPGLSPMDAACLVIGRPANGFPAETESSGQLNPDFARWLMGYPLGWTVLEDWAMQWFRSKRGRRSCVSQGSGEAS